MTARLRDLADEIRRDLERPRNHPAGTCPSCDERRQVLADLEAELALLEPERVHGR